MGLENIFTGISLTRFLEEIDRLGFIWIVKRLSGNDTGLTGGHQAGAYLPRAYFEIAFPEICTSETYNPRSLITCYIPNADITIPDLRAIYYNSKFFPEKGLKKKYDEFRITGWGGCSSPIQDVENTGSLWVFAVLRKPQICLAASWVASSVDEENTIEDWLGEEVEPTRFVMARPPLRPRPEDPSNLPKDWLCAFPSGQEIFEYVANHIPYSKEGLSIDELLLKRRNIEYEVFQLLERQALLPRIQKGFESVDEFIKFAHSASNRRKSRAGSSLELNLERIFRDEKIAFERNAVTENYKRPDFLFPSGQAYHDPRFPAVRLHMLASKTCCKDRWRQVLNEANRIQRKHLFTLQEGVSPNQLQEMQDNNVELVIPAPFRKSFPRNWRESLMTLEDFVRFMRSQQSIDASNWNGPVDTRTS